MEEVEVSENVAPQPACLNCGSHNIETGFKNPLCKECRERFIKYPIPLAIKIFAIAVAVVMIISMVKLPKNISAAIHLKRGKDAETEANYLTAQKEYEKTVELIPDLFEAKCHLLVASFRNMDFRTLLNTSKDIEGKLIEDQSLYSNMSAVMQSVNDYFPSDSFNALMEKYHSSDSIPAGVYKKYISSTPTEIYPILSYASIEFDKKNYSYCDSLLNIGLQSAPFHTTIFSLKTSLKRELHQYDSSMYYCDQLLKLNKESTFGMSSKARTLFRQEKDKEGLQLALKSYDVDRKDPYSIATLAMAYHLNNNISERDKLMNAFKNDSLTATYMQYVNDIISGKEKIRD